MKKPRYRPGKNIAMKVPPDEFDATVAFYRDVLGLKIRRTTPEGSVGFDFGGKTLWIDSVPTLSQAELWLEINASDPRVATQHLRRNGVVRCDGIEALPSDLNAFWIKSPAGIIHLVSES